MDGTQGGVIDWGVVIVKCGAQIALAVGAGYLLGRNRRLRMAVALAAAGATGRLGASGSDLVQQVLKKLGTVPELEKIVDSVRGELFEVGKAAAKAAATKQVDALTSKLHERADMLRTPGKPGGAEEAEEEEPEPAPKRRGRKAAKAREEQEPEEEEEEYEEDLEEEPEEEEELEEEPEEEPEPAPRRRPSASRRRPAAKAREEQEPEEEEEEEEPRPRGARRRGGVQRETTPARSRPVRRARG
ncbi:hypothetical protein Sros_6853 [Streptosporangium roseum DSM 43021]|uniref:Uncharacterized protein n=1 Tax=Streptosporangium roseum (strain ATCC 12428 / DSM 43021 / JCM 3005 / KCTC 9067 / NCIMB 10171 / NRRL 2505 / NI 9100) TaxID=479432 RepID=D2B734_STRRD|nr:hypothetical protein Sros_6853 [Streptosporangium roseum DSM 43021]